MRKRNPLSLFWKIFSNISGVAGIASLSERLIAWKSFIPEIINVYKSIVYSPFKFFNLDVPNLLVDYLFIGSLCGIAFVRAISYGEKNRLLFTHGLPIISRIFYFLLYLLLWPLGLIITLKQVLFEKENISERKIKMRFVQWLGTLAFSFVIITIINSLL